MQIDHNDHKLALVILQCVADHSGYTLDKLCGPRRFQPLALYRQMAYRLIKDLLKISIKDVANELGGRHRTAACNGVEAISGYIETDQAIRSTYREIEARCVDALAKNNFSPAAMLRRESL